MTINIPTYALYGEPKETQWGNFFNHEFFPERSSVYDWKIPPHLHESLIQLLYFRKGNAEVFLNSVRQEISAPGLLLIPSGTVHSLNYTPDVDGPTITASQGPIESIASSLMPNVIQIIRKPAFYTISSDTDARAISKIYAAIEDELRQNRYGCFAACVSLFITLLISIARINSKAITVAETTVSLRKAALVKKFLALIQSKKKPHTSIKEYANEIGVTPGHLSRICRDVLGSSSLDVLNAYIIREVQKDLIYTTKSIKQLADDHGFPDVAYFTRFFKKHANTGPHQFRKIAIKEFYQDGKIDTAEKIAPTQK